MRISNPKLFNGQTLATKQQISAWLAGIDNTGFGTLSIPSANILGLSDIAAAVSTNTANISTISSALGTINVDSETTAFGKIKSLQAAIKEFTGQESDTSGNVISLKNIDDRLKAEITGRAAADEYISGVVTGLSAWQTAFVDKTVEGTGLAQVTSGTVVDGVQKFTVNVPSSAAFYNHDIQLSSVTTIEGYASSYALMVDGVVSGATINIPKDQYLSGVSYDDTTNTLKFAWKLADSTITTTDVKITDLIDTLSGGNGISATGNTVSVKVKTNDKYIDVDATGLYTKGIDEAISGAVSGANAKLAGITDTVSSYVQGQVSGANAKLEGITGTVSSAITDAVSGANAKLEGIETTVTAAITAAVSGANAKLEGIETTVTAAITAAVSGKADTSTVNGIDARLSGAEGEIDALQTTVGKHATAIATAVTFEEVSLAGLSSNSSVTVEGRVMQVFDADGWVYPEVKFITTNGAISSTVSIEEWPTSGVPGLSALVSKKITID